MGARLVSVRDVGCRGYGSAAILLSDRCKYEYRFVVVDFSRWFNYFRQQAKINRTSSSVENGRRSYCNIISYCGSMQCVPETVSVDTGART